MFNETNFYIVDCYLTVFQVSEFFNCLGFISNTTIIGFMIVMIILLSEFDRDIPFNKEKIELVYKYESKSFNKEMDPNEYFNKNPDKAENKVKKDISYDVNTMFEYKKKKIKQCK